MSKSMCSSESSKVFRTIIIYLFKRPLTPSFYQSCSSCWVKFINHPANEAPELKTAEQWGLLRTATSTKEKSAGPCGEVIWSVQKPQNGHELSLPQGFLHCLLDHQELLPLEPQVSWLTGHQGWLQEEEDEERGEANLQKYSCSF